MVIIKSIKYIALFMLFSFSVSAQNKVVVIPLLEKEVADEKIIFITREAFEGDLREKDEFGNAITDGLEGADAKCQSAADENGSLVQGKIFKAWLNDQEPGVRAFASGGRQLNLYALPYVDSNGVKIFSDFTKFEDTEISVIPADQYGVSFENQGLTLVENWAMGLDDTDGFVGSFSICRNWTSNSDEEFGQSATWFRNNNLLDIVVRNGLRFNPGSGVTCQGQLRHLTCLEQ